MTLAEYISKHSLSAEDFAHQVGDVSVSGIRKWISGERQPDADMIERIITLTDGLVTAADMHAVRLAWLRANRPDKFAVAAISEAAE